MANKQKKRRNKKYRGIDAKVTTPTILRVEAEERSAFKEWWLTYGQITRLVGVISGVLLAIALVVVGIVTLFQW